MFVLKGDKKMENQKKKLLENSKEKGVKIKKEEKKVKEREVMNKIYRPI